MNGYNGHFVCATCGKYCGIGDDVPSFVTLEANYGSKYDGNKLTIEVCGSCIDYLLDKTPVEIGEWERTVPW